MKLLVLMLIMAGILACGRRTAEFDAMGHFEADEYTVMAETAGRILKLNFDEGDRIRSGDTIAISDTASVFLQIRQLAAQRVALLSKIPSVRAQEEVVDTEIETLNSERERFGNLVKDQAAASKSLDDINHQIDLAKARKLTFSTQVNSILMEIKVMDEQEKLLNDQLRKCFIIAPSAGTVLVLLMRQSELASPGRVILKMADVDQIILKAYISGDQLSEVKLGQVVKVRIDGPEGSYLDYEGKVYWISDQAEFTPKVIQTKKERVNLVYAIKVRVVNDGRIKIGMPGEMILTHE